MVHLWSSFLVFTVSYRHWRKIMVDYWRRRRGAKGMLPPSPSKLLEGLAPSTPLFLRLCLEHQFQKKSTFIKKQNGFSWLFWRFLHQATGSFLQRRSACSWVPVSFTFIYRGGLRFETLDNEMRRKMKATKPEVLFLSVGGNGINPVSDPKEIFRGICELIQDFRNAGVRHVYISDILKKAHFYFQKWIMNYPIKVLCNNDDFVTIFTPKTLPPYYQSWKSYSR